MIDPVKSLVPGAKPSTVAFNAVRVVAVDGQERVVVDDVFVGGELLVNGGC